MSCRRKPDPRPYMSIRGQSHFLTTVFRLRDIRHVHAQRGRHVDLVLLLLDEDLPDLLFVGMKPGRDEILSNRVPVSFPTYAHLGRNERLTFVEGKVVEEIV
jgi:hypothetical protein